MIGLQKTLTKATILKKAVLSVERFVKKSEEGFKG
ncbi:hypothetical protein HNP94_000958 [Methanococcus maripaludis]|uniref:Uncharacterized protein n=1 Tax=Methanococcus maripaludis TaxID=39152 RepID=A0A7J9SCM6_METMI|nr:hypothetical protein [Methanococcus maripaludis]MBB6496044.1 hypothetical protein [Methanococcus maripaludis]